MHEIQVDDQVMGFLKRAAEPFVDNPNDVLRRLLVDRSIEQPETTGSTISDTSSRPSASAFGVPRALDQVLGVARRVRFGGESRVRATHAVADENAVAFQTVLDKYTRQLDLDASQFDELLNEPSLEGLRKLLLRRFPDQEQLITETIAEDCRMADKSILADWVVESLRARGGEAHHIQIAKDVWQNHEQELRSSGDLFYTWQYDLRWSGQRLRDSGALFPDAQTRRGHWRLRHG